MKALVGAFNQEKTLVEAFSVIVKLVVELMEHYTALLRRWTGTQGADQRRGKNVSQKKLLITSEPRVGPILKLLAAFTSAETGAGWVLVMEGSNTGASHQCWRMLLAVLQRGHGTKVKSCSRPVQD